MPRTLPAEIYFLILRQVHSPHTAAALCTVLSEPTCITAELFAREWLDALHVQVGRASLEKRRARHEFYIALVRLLLPHRTAFNRALMKAALDIVHVPLIVLPRGPHTSYLESKSFELWDLIPDIRFRFRLMHKLAAAVITFCNFGSEDLIGMKSGKSNVDKSSSMRNFMCIFNTICDKLESLSSILRRDFVSSMAYHAHTIGSLHLVQIAEQRGTLQFKIYEQYSPVSYEAPLKTKTAMESFWDGIQSTFSKAFNAATSASATASASTAEPNTISEEEASPKEKKILAALDSDNEEEKWNDQKDADRNIAPTFRLYLQAAERGQLNTLRKWSGLDERLRRFGHVSQSQVSFEQIHEILFSGLANGHIEIMKWALCHGATFDNPPRKDRLESSRNIFLWLCKYGCCEVKKLGRPHFVPLPDKYIEHLMFDFVGNEHDMALFYYQMDRFRDMFNPAALLAVEYGHWPAVKWAFENGYRCTNWICETAAKHGHRHILEYAYENNLIINKNTGNHAVDIFTIFFNAAVAGHVDILDWVQSILQRQGQSITDIALATQFDYTCWHTEYISAVFKLLFKIACTTGIQNMRLMDWILRNIADSDVFKKSMPSQKTILKYIKETGNVGILDMLLKHEKVEIDDNYVEECVAFGAADIVNFVIQRGHDAQSVSLVNQMLNKGHPSRAEAMKKWLQS